MTHHEAAKTSFDLVQEILGRGEDVVTADNLFGFITILDEYASIAGAIVDDARQRDLKRAPPSPLPM